MSSLFRHIPSVDSLLHDLEADVDLPRALLRDLVSEFLGVCREEIRQGVISTPEVLTGPLFFARLRAFIHTRSRPHLRTVINATGVVLHTNLGRSILPAEVESAVLGVCGRYSNLELDLETGQRGSRYSHVESLLCRLTGAEAGLVVNNNAAAVLLVLDTLAKGREVIVSRGELVEIGGSFRIPEVMHKSGAILREVGATNRTHRRDYAQAIGPETAMLMKVHTSNYRIIGFHSDVDLTELTALGNEHGLPVFEDLGSGNLFDFSAFGLSSEPTVPQILKTGVDVVSFSGDKLLGGPQAGIIVGRREYIERIKKNQLNRALRIDKMTLAALEATLRLYLDPDQARLRIPTLRMITATQEELRTRAQSLRRKVAKTLGTLAQVSTRSGHSRVGGGSFPEYDLPTTLVCIQPANMTVAALRHELLNADTPVIGRVEADQFCLDPRTIGKQDQSALFESLQAALQGRDDVGSLCNDAASLS